MKTLLNFTNTLLVSILISFSASASFVVCISGGGCYHGTGTCAGFSAVFGSYMNNTGQSYGCAEYKSVNTVNYYNNRTAAISQGGENHPLMSDKLSAFFDRMIALQAEGKLTEKLFATEFKKALKEDDKIVSEERAQAIAKDLKAKFKKGTAQDQSIVSTAVSGVASAAAAATSGKANDGGLMGNVPGMSKNSEDPSSIKKGWDGTIKGGFVVETPEEWIFEGVIFSNEELEKLTEILNTINLANTMPNKNGKGKQTTAQGAGEKASADNVEEVLKSGNFNILKKDLTKNQSKNLATILNLIR